MINKILITLFTIPLLVSACTGTLPYTPTQAPQSGIEGHITEGPMCGGPVRVGATNCADQPYQAKVTILTENNVEITQFYSDSAGYFKIPLKAGTYILHPEPGNPLPIAGDQTVVVLDGQYTLVSIQYDTGIR